MRTTRTMLITLGILALGTAGSAGALPAPTRQGSDGADPIRVVATLPVYADIARALGGSAVEVSSIAEPNEDAHFVRPKPSFALSIRQADVFITTGLDLELWVPVLLDRAGNARVSEGGTGYITAYTGVQLLDIPVSADRSAGDVHIFGNPHLTTDPLRTLQVARNITLGMSRVAPAHSDRFAQGLERFTDRIHRKLFGDELVELLGGDALERLALGGQLHTFLADQSYEGSSLLDRLGGWLGVMEEARGERIICYHKNWAYFEDRFGVTCAEYVEAKPGIPPTPRHVAELIRKMEDEGLDVMLVADYFDPDKVATVARRGSAVAVTVSLGPRPGVEDYFGLVDRWVNDLSTALAASVVAHP